MEILINEYKQYFTVTSDDYLTLLAKTVPFNKQLTTFKREIPEGKGFSKTPITVVDKYFYTNEEFLRRPILRYNINSLLSLKEYINKHKIGTIRTVKHPPMKGVTISISNNGDKSPRDYQKTYLDIIRDYEKSSLLVDLNTGYGKMHSNRSKLKTPTGTLTIGDAKVGDVILGPDCAPTKIVTVVPHLNKEIFRLTFTDGRSVEVGLDHLWGVYMGSGSKVGAYKVISTREVIEYLDTLSDRSKSTLTIPLATPALGELTPDVTLPISPYLFGILLNLKIEFSNELTIVTEYEDIAAKLQLLKEEFNVTIVSRPDNTVSGKVIHTISNIEDKLSQALNLVGLLKASQGHPTIPDIYFNASYLQRRDLLRGILDSSAMSATARQLEFTHVELTIVEELQKLAHSLGLIAVANNSIKKINYKTKVRLNTLLISGDNLREFVTIDSLKLYLETATTSKLTRLSFIDYESLGNMDATCIGVDNDTKLYLTEDYIVTHNTFISMQALTARKKRFSIIVLARFIQKWIDDVIELTTVTRKEVLVIQGSDGIKNLLSLSKEQLSHYKVIIFSLKTLAVNLNNYLTRSSNISPEHIFLKANTPVILNDESHMENASLTRVLLYANVELVLGLSATLSHSDESINNSFKILFPIANRASNIATVVKFTNAIGVVYGLSTSKYLRHESRFGYNHAIYEGSLLKHHDLKRKYFEMVYLFLDYYFLSKKATGHKAILYFSTVKMCEQFTAYIKHLVGKLSVYKYNEKDDYDTMMASDIIVSTPGSASTGLDIKGLTSVFNTISTGSSILNTQIHGRLRNIEGVKLNYIYFYSRDIKQHRNYSRNNLLLYRRLAKNVTLLNYNKRV